MIISNFNGFKRTLLVIAFGTFLLGSNTVAAQQPVITQQNAQAGNLSEEELETFAKASKSIQEVQLEFQKEMMATMKDEGIEPETFNNMMRAQQSGTSTDEEYSEEEKAAFAKVMDKLMTRQEEMNSDVEEALQEYDLTTEEYQEMAMVIKQSPEAQQKVIKMMTPEE